MGQIETLLVKPVNHLLLASPWATERLHAHAGARVGFVAGPVRLVVQIDHQGLLRACEQEETDVLIELPEDFLLVAMVDRSRLMSSARISGAADIAETLAFVFRNLRWDAEGDLARYLGDIPARRLSMAGTSLLEGARSSSQRVVDNLREYLNEESGLLPNAVEVAEFARAVDQLRDDVARLEKRLQRLG